MRILRKLPWWSVAALLALIPLWFLPVTQNILSYQKQALLLAGVFVALVAWLGRSINEGEAVVKKSWIHLPVLGVLAAAGGSALSSLWPYASLWGMPLSVSDSVLTILGFTVLYMLVVFVMRGRRDILRAEAILLASGSAAVLFALLQAYGVFVLPFSFARSVSFTTIGSMNAAAVLAAALLPLALVLARAASGIRNILAWAGTALLLLVLVLINFQTAWIALIGGGVVLFSFSMWNVMRRKQEAGGISLSMALIVVALFFSFFRPGIPGRPSVPVEVSPSQGEELRIARSVLADNAVLGTGPGTFSLAFAKHRSPELNQTIFWGTRFDSGASAVLDWLVTKGVLGALALLALMGTAVVVAVRGLTRENGDAFWIEGVGAFSALAVLLVAQFLYPAGFVLWFFFWALLALLSAALAGAKEARISIAPPSMLALAASFVFLLVLIFGLGLFFVGGQKYYAEVAYLRGVRSAAQGDADVSLAWIRKAANLNPNMDAYWRNLSQLYLGQVSRVGAREDLADDQKNQLTQALISSAVQTANNAAAIAPVNAANWVVRGFVYRSLIGIEGAEQFALESYRRAAELEPSSPFNEAEMGRVNLVKAQSVEKGSQKDGYLDEAVGHLQASLDLKQDYAPAHYLLALVYDEQGKTEEAVSKLEETLAIAPQDVGLAFQLGMIYWQRGEMAKAQTALERARSANPSYSNARYMLGLVYDRRGEKQKAVSEFERVAELNPENREVGKILENLKNGDPALEGVNIPAPPIQETPPEIQDEASAEVQEEEGE